MNTKSTLNAINNGLINVINHEQFLNETNFFPVADADSGTNLKLSFLPLVGKLNNNLDEIKKIILTNASGNSGLIFGAYLISLLSNIILGSEIKFALQEAQNSCYNSISEPKEGTILTAISIFTKHFTGFDKLEVIINDLELKKLEISKLLKSDTKIVDSGVMAFIYFLKGINDYHNNKILVIKSQLNSEFNFEQDINKFENFRYCIQVIVKGNITKENILNDLLIEFDSLVIINSQDMCSIHLHSNNVNEVFDYYDSKYLIIKSKVQDMKQDYNLQNKKSDKVVIYDSIGDYIPTTDKVNSYCLYMPLTIDGVIYQDRLNFSNNHLIKKIKKGSKLTSSQPSVENVVSILQKVQDYGYKEVIFVSVSKKMSGTYDKINYAVNYFNKHSNLLNIQVIDSTYNSSAQGLIIGNLIELFTNNIKFTDIKHKINNLIYKTQIFVNVSDLEPMYLSGRLKKNLYNIISFFKLGAIVTISKGFGKIKVPILKKSSPVKNLTKIILNKNISKIYISYTTNINNALELEKIINQQMPQIKIQIMKTSSIVAGFAGSNALSIGFMEVDYD